MSACIPHDHGGEPLGGQCPAVRAALEAIRRAAAIEVLLATPVTPWDIERQATLATRYQPLRQAGTLSIGPTDLQVARRAYDLQLFAVAQVAFESSLKQGSFPRDNPALVQQYASTLYNLAHWSLQAPTPIRQEAGGLAAASYCIEQAFGLPYAESEILLRHIAGDDPVQWPRPVSTPLLAGIMCAGR